MQRDDARGYRAETWSASALVSHVLSAFCWGRDSVIRIGIKNAIFFGVFLVRVCVYVFSPHNRAKRSSLTSTYILGMSWDAQSNMLAST